MIKQSLILRENTVQKIQPERYETQYADKIILSVE